MPPNRIAELREARGLSRVALAVLCGVTTEVTIARWERGETAVPDKAKFTLAEHFEVSIEYLMGWDRQAPESPSKAAA